MSSDGASLGAGERQRLSLRELEVHRQEAATASAGALLRTRTRRPARVPDQETRAADPGWADRGARQRPPRRRRRVARPGPRPPRVLQPALAAPGRRGDHGRVRAARRVARRDCRPPPLRRQARPRRRPVVAPPPPRGSDGRRRVQARGRVRARRAAQGDRAAACSPSSSVLDAGRCARRRPALRPVPLPAGRLDQVVARDAAEFSRAFLSGGVRVVNKHLGLLGATLQHKQSALDDDDFSVASLTTDLRDGVRLYKLCDVTAVGAPTRRRRRLDGARRPRAAHATVRVTRRARAPTSCATRGSRSTASPSAASCRPATGRDASRDLKRQAALVVDGHCETTLDVLWALLSAEVMPTRPVRRGVARGRARAQGPRDQLVSSACRASCSSSWRPTPPPSPTACSRGSRPCAPSAACGRARTWASSTTRTSRRSNPRRGRACVDRRRPSAGGAAQAVQALVRGPHVRRCGSSADASLAAER